MREVSNIPQMKERRRNLRNNLTVTERILWEKIRKKRLKGYKFRRQYSIDYYVLDFYCPALKLAIEVDGEYHNRPEVKIYDEIRQRNIEFYDIKFIRFTNDDVVFRIDYVINSILQQLPGAPSSSLSSRRGPG